MAGSVLPTLAPNTSVEKQKTTIQLIAAIARHSPTQIAPYIKDIVTNTIKALARDDEELKESSLQVRFLITQSFRSYLSYATYRLLNRWC